MYLGATLSRATRHLTSPDNLPHPLAGVGFAGFALSILSLTTIHIGTNFTDIPTDQYFFLYGLPVLYWVGIGTLVVSILLLTRFDGWGVRWAVALSFLLMLAMRVVLTLTLTTWLPYDSISRDIPQIETWVQSGINFVPGTYAHNWPLSYLIAYAFVKAGIPVDGFFEWAIAPIYAIDAFLVYSISSLIVSRREAALTVFLFALVSQSTEGGVLTMFYNPALIGGTFFLLSLYLTLKLAKRGTAAWTALLVPCGAIVLMILSHHLTVLYFILVVLGVWLLSKTRFSRITHWNFRIFPFLTLFTSVVWVVYGVLVYPGTLGEWLGAVPQIVLHGRQYQNAYTSTGVGSYFSQPFFEMFAFMAVPIFIGGLFLLHLYRVHRRDAVYSGRFGFLRSWAQDKVVVLSAGLLWALGGAFVFGLAFSGILYPIRSLEFLLFLMTFVASTTLDDWLAVRRAELRFLIVILAVVATVLSVYWTYHIIQRTIPLWIKDLSGGG